MQQQREERRTEERLVNLTIALLTARSFVPKSVLREKVYGIHDDKNKAFDRMFDRDKQALRDLGIIIETGKAERYMVTEPGYRIIPSEFELPPVSFTPAETTVLMAAAQVWEDALPAESADRALTKLKATGVESDVESVVGLRPHIAASEPAWKPLWKAWLARSRVAFDYHGITRQVSPYAVGYRYGAWYMAGFDATRDAIRLFKLSRIEGEVTPVGDPGAYELPAVPTQELLAGLMEAPPDAVALLEVRKGRAPWLTRRAELVDENLGEWRRWRYPFAHGNAVVDGIAMAGKDVRVLEPAELAQAVALHHEALVARLEAQS